MRIGVIADDLTGAGDAGLAFSRGGRRVEMALWPPDRPSRGTEVWAISTESRGLSDRAAGLRVRRAAALLNEWKASFVFKKIDSTLRGPVAAELGAFAKALGASPRDTAVVPAFPALGRTVRGGRLFVGGRPVDRTAFGRDPRHPLKTSRVADVVGKEFWIPDAPDEKALRRAARETLRRGAKAAAGSAGFAAALADILGTGARAGKRGTGGMKRVRRRSACRPSVPARVLVVSGSAHPRSRKQGHILKRAGLDGVIQVEAPRERGDPGSVLRDLARRAGREARAWKAKRFAVTGGETAAALARAVGVRRWTLVGEVERGVPLAASAGTRERSWWVTKPGGYGREDAWIRAIRLLQKTPLRT